MKKFLIESLQTIVGAFIMAIGTSLFLLPNQLSTGGFSGIATITYYLFNMQMGRVILLLNIPLFIISFFKIGKSFLLKAIVGTFSLSFFIDFLDRFHAVTDDRLLGCVFGGIITGIGTAIILRADGSTGGTELLTNLINHYKVGIKTSSLIVIIDTIIVILNIIFLKEIEIGLYSAIAIYIMGKMLDIFFEGIYFTKVMYIISDKYEEIAQKINVEIKRGVTGLYGKGMYTGQERTVLMCVAGRREIIKLRREIKQIDKNAFIILSDAREVLGEGFKNQ